jgi:hypothetical protein
MLHITERKRGSGRFIYVSRENPPQALFRFWQKNNNVPKLKWAHQDCVYLDDMEEAVLLVSNYVATT